MLSCCFIWLWFLSWFFTWFFVRFWLLFGLFRLSNLFGLFFLSLWLLRFFYFSLFFRFWSFSFWFFRSFFSFCLSFLIFLILLVVLFSSSLGFNLFSSFLLLFQSSLLFLLLSFQSFSLFSSSNFSLFVVFVGDKKIRNIFWYWLIKYLFDLFFVHIKIFLHKFFKLLCFQSREFMWGKSFNLKVSRKFYLKFFWSDKDDGIMRILCLKRCDFVSGSFSIIE